MAQYADLTFRNPEHDDRFHAVVVTPETASDYAQPLLNVRFQAWQHEFVGQQGLSTEIDLRAVIDPDDPALQADLIAQAGNAAPERPAYVSNTYLALHRDGEEQDPGSAIGMARVIEYKPRKPWEPNYPYLRDINIMPPEQHKHLGMLMTFAAVYPYKDTRKAAAYIYAENAHARSFFSNLGFVRQRESRHGPLLGGELTVSELHYELPRLRTMHDAIYRRAAWATQPHPSR